MRVDHLQGDLSRGFEPIRPTAGIHLVAWLKMPLASIGEDTPVAAACKASIGLCGPAPFHNRVTPQPALISGYGSIAIKRIGPALTTFTGILRCLVR